ncbi:MAG TPA: hypothetical protein PLW93_06060 [Candidatus Absconditabacterales bacterium]|nr:hypothetical protein [Candidatus Absconditabacterales bacterium]
MDPELSTSYKKEIYILIGIGCIGFGLILWFLFRNRNGSNINNSTLITNNIIENSNNLPIECQSTLQILECISQDTRYSGDTTSITLYHQKLISEWNLLTKDKLIQACTTQKEYLTQLSGGSIEQIKHCLIQ